jgi:tRNA threonylcarbamoyladenosine modification (KEOPS) complex  Pcc1 subunit
MKSEIEIECKNSQAVVKALRPEVDKTKKFSVSIKAEKGKIVLRVESKDISGMLAGVNSYVTLIKTSINTMEA